MTGRKVLKVEKPDLVLNDKTRFGLSPSAGGGGGGAAFVRAEGFEAFNAAVEVTNDRIEVDCKGRRPTATVGLNNRSEIVDI